MRWLFRLIGVVLSLAVLAVAALFLIPGERLANLAAQQVTAATGRSLVFTGEVRPTIWPHLGVTTGEVMLGNAEWSSAGPMIQAEALEIALDLRALVGGEIAVRRVAVLGPDILLERAADGRANWEFRPATGPAQPPAARDGSAAFTIDTAELRRGRVTLIDHENGTRQVFDDIDATLGLPDLAGPAELTLAMRHDGQTIRADARIERFADALAGQVVPLRLNLALGQAQAGFEGRAGLGDGAAEGKVSLSVPDLATLGAAPGIGGITASAQLTVAPAGSVHLRDATLSLGAGRVTGAADITLDGPRPRIVAQIAGDRLDLTALGAGGGAGPTPPAAPGWPRGPIDASALGLADAEIGLDFGAVDLGMARAGPVRASLVIDRSRAVLSLREVGLHGGRLGGELVLNNRSGLSAGGDLRLRDVALLPLLSDAAGFRRIDGKGSADLRFLAVGGSVDAMMRSLSGEGRIDLGRGEILGFDLAGILRNLDLSYMGEGRRTIYDAISGSFTIADGVLRSEDLRLDAALVEATARGAVDIGRRTLDMRLVPVALPGQDRGGIRVPLLITGAWEEPRLRLDMQGLADERLREERERLEQRAREEAERALDERLRLEREEGERLQDAARRRAEEEAARRLGVDAGEGERPQDAARRRLEEEAGRRLRGILGGN